MTPRYALYGIVVGSEHGFSWPLPRTDAAPTLRFEVRSDPPEEIDLDVIGVVHGTPLHDSLDDPAVTFHSTTSGTDIVRFRGAADHYLYDDRIVCHLFDPANTHLVEIQLLGTVLALWLERRGVATLHASVAAVDGQAVAFLGVPGGGKTTAATALVAAGHPLVVDDLLALDVGDDVTLAHPGYPMLRLWPEQADHLVGPHAELPLVQPGIEKRKVAVGDGFGSFQATSVPLRRVYLPQRWRIDTPVTITGMRSSEALIALVKDSFVGLPAEGLGLAGGRLRTLARALDHLEVRTIRYPTGFDRLPELVDAVERDLRDDAGAPR